MGRRGRVLSSAQWREGADLNLRPAGPEEAGGDEEAADDGGSRVAGHRSEYSSAALALVQRRAFVQERLRRLVGHVRGVHSHRHVGFLGSMDA